MRTIVIQVILVIATCTFHPARGFVFFVQPKHFDHGVRAERHFCYTNESDSAIAFLRDAYQGDAKGTVRYQAISNAVYNEGKSDCNLFTRCDAWNVDDFERVANFADEEGGDQFPPVFDRRWNEVAEKVVSGKGKKEVGLLELDDDSEGVFFLWVHARQAKILLTKNAGDAKDDFLLSFDDFKKRHFLQSDSIILSQASGETVLNEGWEWALLEFNYSFINSTVSLEIGAAGQSVMQIFNVSVAEDNYSKWTVKAIAPGKYSSSNFKVHNYTVLKPRSQEAEMHTEVEFTASKQPLCLDLTYFSGGGEDRKGLVVELKVAESGKSKRFEIFEASLEDAWVTKRFQVQDVDQGKYVVSVKTAIETTFIGDVRFCAAGPELVETTDWSWECQSLKTKTHRANISANSHEMEALLESDAICNIVGGDDCEGVQFCNYHFCSCFPGFQFDANHFCNISCANENKYGVNCTHDFVGRCLEDKYNVHTGHCRKGCQKGFKPPFCSRKLLEFSTAPEVTKIGAYSALVDFKFAMERLQETRKSEMQFFHSVDLLIQTMKPNGKNWTEWSKLQTFDIRGPFQRKLDKLRPTQKYNVVALIREKAGDSNQFQTWQPATFQTEQCKSFDAKNIRIERMCKSLNFRLERVSTDPDLCHVTKVEVQNYAKQEPNTENNALNKLDDDSPVLLNKVIIHGDDGKAFSFHHIAGKSLQSAEQVLVQ